MYLQNVKRLKTSIFLIVNILMGLPWFVVLVVSYIYFFVLFGMGVLLFIGYLLIWLSVNWFILNPGSKKSEKFKYLLLGFFVSLFAGMTAFILPEHVLDNVIEGLVEIIQS